MCLWLKRKVCGSTNNDETEKPIKQHRTGHLMDAENTERLTEPLIYQEHRETREEAKNEESRTETPIKQHRKGHLMDAENTERLTEPLIYQEHGETREEATNEESKPEPARNNEHIMSFREGKLSDCSVDGVIMVSNQPFDDNVDSTISCGGMYRVCTPKPGTMKCTYIFLVSDMKILEDESKSGYAERVKMSLYCLLDMAKQKKCSTVAMDTISFLDVKESAAMMIDVIFETGSPSEDSYLKKLYIVDDKRNLKSFMEAFNAYRNAGRHVKKSSREIGK